MLNSALYGTLIVLSDETGLIQTLHIDGVLVSTGDPLEARDYVEAINIYQDTIKKAYNFTVPEEMYELFWGSEYAYEITEEQFYIIKRSNEEDANWKRVSEEINLFLKDQSSK